MGFVQVVNKTWLPVWTTRDEEEGYSSDNFSKLRTQGKSMRK